jgi:hypothetical protein
MNRLQIKIVLMVLAAVSCNAAGRTIVVSQDVPADFGTIAEAVADAVNGDTIEIDGGTYYETIDLGGLAVTVRLFDESDPVIIDGSGTSQCIVCDSGETSDSQFIGLTIQNGNASHGGGIYIDDSLPTMVECKIFGCTATHGGGIYVTGSVASPHFEDCHIESCVADQRGGGVMTWLAGSLTMTGCTVTLNEAGNNGGGMSLEYTDTITLTACEVSYNTNGGINASINTALILDQCQLLYNDAAGTGGGMRLKGTSAWLIDSTITGNYGGSRGAGIYVNVSGADLTLSMQGCVIQDNETGGYGTYGAGLCLWADTTWSITATIDSCSFNGNGFGGGGYGAALAAHELVDTTITNSDFCDHDWDNEVDGDWTDGGGNTITNAWCLPGDIDEDGAVGAMDLLLLVESWTDAVDEDDRWDINRDAIIDVTDLLEMLGEWGSES